MARWLAEWRRNEGAASAASQQPEYWAPDQPWQVELNQKAQQHMRETDNAVFAYQSRMRVPQSWDPNPGVIYDDPGDLSGGSDSSASGSSGGGSSAGGRSIRPPSIPPVPPLDNSGAGRSPAGGDSPPATGPVLSGGLVPAGAPGAGDVPSGAGSHAGPGSAGSWMGGTPHGKGFR